MEGQPVAEDCENNVVEIAFEYIRGQKRKASLGPGVKLFGLHCTHLVHSFDQVLQFRCGIVRGDASRLVSEQVLGSSKLMPAARKRRPNMCLGSCTRTYGELTRTRALYHAELG